MNNPWKDSSLSDYENHMALDSVQQLQAMNEIDYHLIQVLEYQLPNGKKLVQFDFYKQTVTQR